MLESRLVHTSLMCSSLTARFAEGCQQGGVLSSLFWNLAIDKLLAVINGLDFSTFGYADDIVNIVQGKYAHTVREIMQEPLNVVVKLTDKEVLNIIKRSLSHLPLEGK